MVVSWEFTVAEGGGGGEISCVSEIDLGNLSNHIPL